MQTDYLTRLPGDMQELVLSTEHAVGFQVEVVVDPLRASATPGHQNALACEVDKDSARLLTPSEDHFRPGSVFHELLHIRRFLVEGIPRITDDPTFDGWSLAIATALTLQDNCIEHLSIVPRELARFPHRRNHWESAMARVWAEIAAGKGSAIDCEQAALANWTFLSLVLPDSPSAELAERMLVALGLNERAQRLCGDLFPVLPDKAATVRVWFEHLRIPPEVAALQYFAPLEARSWEVPLVPAARRPR